MDAEQYFNFIMAVSFIDGEKQRKPLIFVT